MTVAEEQERVATDRGFDQQDDPARCGDRYIDRQA